MISDVDFIYTAVNEGSLDGKKTCLKYNIYCICRVRKQNFINTNRIENKNERAEWRVTEFSLVIGFPVQRNGKGNTIMVQWGFEDTTMEAWCGAG